MQINTTEKRKSGLHIQCMVVFLIDLIGQLKFSIFRCTNVTNGRVWTVSIYIYVGKLRPLIGSLLPYAETKSQIQLNNGH